MGKLIGIDTAVLIYVLEDNPKFSSPARDILHSVETGRKQAIFSAIGMIELLAGPKRQQRYDLANQYRSMLIGFPNLTIMGINEQIVEIASDLRATYGLKTPDAIHIATAISAKADVFITNDKGLKNIKEIKIELLS